MMKNLSSRLAPYNISVNDVSPAMVGSTGLLPSADSVPGVVDNIPLKRLCAPEEVANVVLMYARTGFATVSTFSCILFARANIKTRVNHLLLVAVCVSIGWKTIFRFQHTASTYHQFLLFH